MANSFSALPPPLPPLFTAKVLRTTTIHPGIFLGRTLWADSVSTRMTALASRDQLKPIKTGENLVVNYND